MKRFTIQQDYDKEKKHEKKSKIAQVEMCSDIQKNIRNVRDKEYKRSMAEKIFEFLRANEYEGPYEIGRILDPTNKEFQNIFKFIYSFIDGTQFSRFEEDLLAILKLLKYPYIGEITKSHLMAVTPHTWPVLLSMIGWFVDLIMEIDRNADFASTTNDSIFIEYIKNQYKEKILGHDCSFSNGGKLRNGIYNGSSDTEKTSLEKKIEKWFSDENREIGKSERIFIRELSEYYGKKEILLEKRIAQRIELENEIEKKRSDIKEFEKLQIKKSELNENINKLAEQDLKLDIKRKKYIEMLEQYAEDIRRYEKIIDNLIKTRDELQEKINGQSMNKEDIQEMYMEKNELLNELEKLKGTREDLELRIKKMDEEAGRKNEENERIMDGIKIMGKWLKDYENIGKDIEKDEKLLEEIEKRLDDEKEKTAKNEMDISMLNEEIKEFTMQCNDAEEKYKNYHMKLETIGSIYIEKKEIFDRIHQKNRSEMDKLENDLLRLKLESDSVFLKTEKEISEASIRLDLQRASILRDREEIKKKTWYLHSVMEQMFQTIESIRKDLEK